MTAAFLMQYSLDDLAAMADAARADERDIAADNLMIVLGERLAARRLFFASLEAEGIDY